MGQLKIRFFLSYLETEATFDRIVIQIFLQSDSRSKTLQSQKIATDFKIKKIKKLQVKFSMQIFCTLRTHPGKFKISNFKSNTLCHSSQSPQIENKNNIPKKSSEIDFQAILNGHSKIPYKI